MSSKFIVPIEITDFRTSPDAPGTGFVKIYTIDSWLKIQLSSGIEKDAVLDRPLDNLSLPVLASSILDTDTVIESFAKLQKTINTIKLVGDVVGTGTYSGGEFVITTISLGGGSVSGAGNLVFATPDGLSGVGSLRALVDNDLPVVPYVKGGTGLSTLGSPLQALRVNVLGNALEYYTPSLVGDLDDLSDVVITGPTAGDLLKFDGLNWINFSADYAGITTSDINLWNQAVGWGDHSLAGYLTSYTETDPIYTASSWYTTVNNSVNWDTAYSNRISSLTTTGSSGAASLILNTLNIPNYTLAGLGGQPLSTNLTSLSGLSYVSASFVKMTASGTFTLDTNTYLTSYTETDPIYTSSSWYTTTNNSSNWDTAFGWGNHASAGYYVGTSSTIRGLFSETITGIDYDNTTGVFSLTTGYVIPTTTEQSNWNTAYSWGNHASAGYLTTISGIVAGGELSGTYVNPSLVNSAVIGKVLTGISITNSAIVATDSILIALGKAQGQINNKENTITAGLTSQYWRGDKSWQTLDKAAVGLSNVENTALSTWTGSTNITTLGTIVTGTWNATIISASKGGTGIDTSGSSGYAKVTTGTWSIINAATLKTDLSLNNVENTALSTWTGSSNITTLGTISTGTWNGSTIAIAYGGTNITSYTLGDTLYASATNVLSKLAGNTTTTRKFLTQTGNGSISAAPAWNTIAYDDLGTGYTSGTMYLSYNGSSLSWAAGAGGTPGGADTNIQFNDGGAFGGTADFVFNKTAKTVSLAGTAAFIDVSQTASFTVGYKIGSAWVTRYHTTLNNFIFGNNSTTYGSITTGNNNFFAGNTAIASGLTSGYNNIAIGFDNSNNEPLRNLTQGNSNVALLRGALRGLTTGFSNVAIGEFALYSMTTTGDNIAVGYYAFRTYTRSGGIAIGTYAFENFAGNGSEDDYSIAIGYTAGRQVSNGRHVLIGYVAARDMSGATSDGVTAIGPQAGYGLRTSTYDTILGGFAMGYFNSLQTTTANVALGYGSMQLAMWSRYMVSIGYQAGYQNATATANGQNDGSVYIGYQSAYSNLGNYNLFLGYRSGYTETTASNTLIIANNSASTDELIRGSFADKWVRIQDTLRFTARASNPSVSEAGHIYYNSTDVKHKWYNGTDTIALSPDLIKPVSIWSPTSTDKITLYKTEKAITIRKLFDVVVGSSTPSVTWQIKHATTRDSGAPNNLFAAGRTTTSTAGANTTTFNDATIPAGSYIWLELSAVSGTVDEFNISFLVTED